jgi:hypothetical protein
VTRLPPCDNEYLYRRRNCKGLGIEEQRRELTLTILKTELLLLSVNLPFIMSSGEIKVVFLCINYDLEKSQRNVHCKGEKKAI